ncbi:clumping factor A-like [Cydia splendana]|uniref:clumping factor A-like n=1 Tax=Cydia splendana TaxID=1100963 RepID=UPI00300C9A5D
MLFLVSFITAFVAVISVDLVGVSYYFDEHYSDVFSDRQCVNTTRWSLVSYENLKLVPPYEGRSKAVRALRNSCTATFPMSFLEGSLKVTVYLRTISQYSGITVSVFDDRDEVITSVRYQRSNKNFVPGWVNVKVPINEHTTGYVQISGKSLNSELVVVDSLRYIPGNITYSQSDIKDQRVTRGLMRNTPYTNRQELSSPDEFIYAFDEIDTNDDTDDIEGSGEPPDTEDNTEGPDVGTEDSGIDTGTEEPDVGTEDSGIDTGTEEPDVGTEDSGIDTGTEEPDVGTEDSGIDTGTEEPDVGTEDSGIDTGTEEPDVGTEDSGIDTGTEEPDVGTEDSGIDTGTEEPDVGTEDSGIDTGTEEPDVGTEDSGIDTGTEEPEEDRENSEDSNFWNAFTITLVSVGAFTAVGVVGVGAYYLGKSRSVSPNLLLDLETQEAPSIIPRARSVFAEVPYARHNSFSRYS